MIEVILSPSTGYTNTPPTVQDGHGKIWFQEFFSEQEFILDKHIVFEKKHLTELIQMGSAEDICFAKQKISNNQVEKNTIATAAIKSDFELFTDRFCIGNLFPATIPVHTPPKDRDVTWTVNIRNPTGNDEEGLIKFVWKDYLTKQTDPSIPVKHFLTVSFHIDWLNGNFDRIIFMRGFVDLYLKEVSGQNPTFKKKFRVEILIAFGATTKNEITTDAFLPYGTWPVKYPPYTDADFVAALEGESLPLGQRIVSFFKNLFNA